MAQATTPTTPERKRAVSIVVYDLQGGPFPEKAANELELAAHRVAEKYDGLAITVVQE